MYLGIDLGTSSVKAVLVGADGSFLRSASAALTVSRPQPGWSEQAPADWIAATEAAIARLGALTDVRGIGLSGQMHGATLLGADDRPLRPCILWNDGRAAREAAELDCEPAFRALTGNIVFPGFTAPKLVWVARHEPEVFAATRRVLLPKDYLRLWLSGEAASDLSDASGTAWVDVGGRRWAEPLLARTGMTRQQMPRLVEGTEPAGTLRADLAARWGMTAGPVTIAGGAGDNAASAIGIGAVAPGDGFVSLGTSGVLFTVSDRFAPAPESAVHSFCHALPGTWHQMGVILSAAASLEWLAGITGRSAEDLAAALGDRLAPPSRVKFLPYLSGERTPHNDTSARAAFAGLDHSADAATLAQAVLEGVAFALRDNLDALAQAGGAPTAVTAVGGGSRSRAWLRIIATTLGLPVVVPAEGETGAAFGAARLGLIAATGADPLAVCTAPATEAVIEPDADLAPVFSAAHAQWRALYPAIRGALS